jgi:hypothetical protein
MQASNPNHGLAPLAAELAQRARSRLALYWHFSYSCRSCSHFQGTYRLARLHAEGGGGRARAG